MRVWREDREFTPSEAAEITGVSVDLQRDWRRRAIVTPKKDTGWTRFDVAGLVQLYLLRALGDAGFDLKTVSPLVSMAMLPTLRLVLASESAIAFAASVSPEDRAIVEEDFTMTNRDPRWIAIAHGATDGDAPMAVRTVDFKAIGDWIANGVRKLAVMILSLEEIADSIMERIEDPVVSFHAEASD